MKPDVTSVDQIRPTEDRTASHLSGSVPQSGRSSSSEGYSSFPSSSSTGLFKSQSKIDPTVAVSAGPTEIIESPATTQTITMERGPVFERFPTTTPEILPTRYMPPFTASLVFPSKPYDGVGPVYAIAGGRDARQGVQMESAVFQRTPSGRYHFVDAQHESSGTRSGSSMNSQSTSFSSSGPQRVEDKGSASGGGGAVRVNQAVVNMPERPGATNDFVPTTYVDRQALLMDSNGKQATSVDAYRHRGQNSSPQSSEQNRFQTSENKTVDPTRSPNSSPNDPDAYGRPSQLRFASMSVISNTYFRKPGTNVQDPKKTEVKSGQRSRRTRDSRSSDANPSPMPSTSLSPASPTAMIRPMQSVHPAPAESTSLSSKPLGSVYPGYLATGRVTPMPSAENRSALGARSFGAAPRNNPSISHPGAPRYGPPASSQPGYSMPYQLNNNFAPGTVGIGHPSPVRSKRISFSDEHFIPTHDTLYQLDGYGAYYHHSSRYDPERSPSHLKPNAPRPLRRRVSGESADESLSRPLVYQQRLAPSTTANVVLPQGNTQSMAHRRYAPSPDNFHRQDVMRQSLSGFQSPSIPQNPLHHSVPSRNDPSAASDSAQRPPSASSRFPQGYAHVPTYSTVSASAVVTTSANVTTYSNVSAHQNVSVSPNVSTYPTVSISPNYSTYPTVSVSPNASTYPTVSISSNVSTYPTVSISPNVSTYPTVSISPNVSTYPTVSISPNYSTYPTVSISPNYSTYPTVSISSNVSTYPNVSPYTNVSAYPNVPTYPDASIYQSQSTSPSAREANASADAAISLSVLDVDISSPGVPLSQSLLSPSSSSPRNADASPSAASSTSRDSLSPVTSIPPHVTGIPPPVTEFPSLLSGSETNVPVPSQKYLDSNLDVISAQDESGGDSEPPLEGEPDPIPLYTPTLLASKRSNLKRMGAASRTSNRVTFDPLVLLLDACLEGELDTVMRTARKVSGLHSVSI